MPLTGVEPVLRPRTEGLVLRCEFSSHTEQAARYLFDIKLKPQSGIEPDKTAELFLGRVFCSGFSSRPGLVEVRHKIEQSQGFEPCPELLTPWRERIGKSKQIMLKKELMESETIRRQIAFEIET